MERITHWGTSMESTDEKPRNARLEVPEELNGRADVLGHVGVQANRNRDAELSRANG
ncbi:hypothetical protein AB0E04_16975 [Streptomyces sp. NPDC048251]|uniref:hypothetical protein n=1 Tax=Streptomyces sp. NPDC048251 TaxID=3154501 RepID=UPI00342DC68F